MGHDVHIALVSVLGGGWVYLGGLLGDFGGVQRSLGFPLPAPASPANFAEGTGCHAWAWPQAPGATEATSLQAKCCDSNFKIFFVYSLSCRVKALLLNSKPLTSWSHVPDKKNLQDLPCHSKLLDSS